MEERAPNGPAKRRREDPAGRHPLPGSPAAPPPSAGEPRGVVLLGATGSIGASTLAVVDRFPRRLRVAAVAAGRSSPRLAEIAARYRPDVVALGSGDERDRFAREHGREAPAGTRILGGGEGLRRAALHRSGAGGGDVVVSAIVGAAGLAPTLAALEAGRTVALANKESLVAAGTLMTSAAAASGATLIPIDSEHAAIHQCLEGRATPFRRIWLTASGGPFRTATSAEMADVTPAMALRHPTWEMGPKISVDSATMMNKGLERIEACRLFAAAPEAVRVVVHPESVAHSLVEFEDGTLLAQLGATDMRTPIQYALTRPERLDTGLAPLPLGDAPLDLRFEPPDPERFPCLRLADEALAAGGDAPAVLNAANEVAVAAFLDGRAGFLDIPAVVGETLARHRPTEPTGLADVMAADRGAREEAGRIVAGLRRPRAAAAPEEELRPSLRAAC